MSLPCSLCVAASEAVTPSSPVASADHIRGNPDGRQGCTTREECWERICRTVHWEGRPAQPAKTQSKPKRAKKTDPPPPDQGKISFSL